MISKIIGNQEKPVSNSGENIALTSNPNLLINPWFTVNQRGVTSFSGSSDDVKTADRWLARRATGSVNSNGISFAWDEVHSTNGLIATHIEDMPDLFGKTVTLSALVNGSIISYSFTLNDNETKYVGDNNEFYIDSKNLTGGIIINYYNYTTTAVTVRAMKLEIGSTSTLHLDTAPDYTTELLKCRRYGRMLWNAPTSSNVGFGIALSSTVLRMFVTLDGIIMRITPAAKYSSLSNIRIFTDSTNYKNPSALSISLFSGGLIVDLTTTDLVVNSVYKVNVYGDSLFADAEL